jgi:hypothetical protein
MNRGRSEPRREARSEIIDRILAFRRRRLVAGNLPTEIRLNRRNRLLLDLWASFNLPYPEKGPVLRIFGMNVIKQ